MLEDPRYPLSSHELYTELPNLVNSTGLVMQKFWYIVHPLGFTLGSNYVELDAVKQAFVSSEMVRVLKEQFSFQQCLYIKIVIFWKNIPSFPYFMN